MCESQDRLEDSADTSLLNLHPMRFLPLVLLSAAAVAQSPLVAPFNSNNGQSGNQFDLVAINPVVITGFDVNIDGVEVRFRATHAAVFSTPHMYSHRPDFR